MSKSEDLFAEIGMERNDGSAFGYQPAPLHANPPPLRGEMIEPEAISGRGRADPAAEFAASLETLRGKLSPFLREIASPEALLRKRIKLHEFSFQRAEGPVSFRDVLEGKREWETVRIPHYGGPIGKARAFYRTEWEDSLIEPSPEERLFVHFQGVDYRAKVYLNGACLGTHEGGFAPFEFDLAPYREKGRNVLLVEVENEGIIHGNFPYENLGFSGAADEIGDRIYASTGFGWDDPQGGWINCPPGMGICQPVWLETRPALFVRDVFARPLPFEDLVEITVELHSTHARYEELAEVAIAIEPRNFEGGESYRQVHAVGERIGSGRSDLRFRVRMDEFRWWHPDSPHLYWATVTLGSKDGRETDGFRRSFGMRSFSMETQTSPLGRFYLNGEEVRLRGANNMGSFLQRVFKAEWEGLAGDILLARAGNLNFLRLTQMPRQSEVYDYCSRLGLLTQTDLPLFGELNRSQWFEAIKQAGEMERLVRDYPCNVLNSFVNERGLGGLNQPLRHLDRSGMESFYRAAGDAVALENPDRVIKENDGDYSPPSPGYPDLHAYSGWYNGNGVDIGMLHKGYWQQQVTPDWRYGCGEYGAEGLDRRELALACYPRAWLPDRDEREWHPSQIMGAQTGKMVHLWYETPEDWNGWIEQSRLHQAWATDIMTRAFRRDPRMNSFAIHLLIDAFPATWMKSIVDYERVPKPSFFAFREALEPINIHWRTDRFTCFAGDSPEAEIWFCNDTHRSLPNARIEYILEVGEEVMAFEIEEDLPAFDSVCLGVLQEKLPEVGERTKGRLTVGLFYPESGKRISHHELSIEIFPPRHAIGSRVRVVGQPGGRAERLAEGLDIAVGDDSARVILVDSIEEFEKEKPLMREALESGSRIVVLEMPPGTHGVLGDTVTLEPTGYDPRHFCGRGTGHRFVRDFLPNDFRFWFDEDAGFLTPFVPGALIADDDWEVVLEAASGPGQTLVQKEWEPAGAVLAKKFGKGEIVLCPIKLHNRVRSNPVARRFAANLLDAQ